jgi:DNA-binding IclR family transcriptional regulator
MQSRPARQADARYNVDTAVRTIDILEVVGRQDRPLGLGEIVAELGWTKPAVYRLLRTLEALGALRRIDGKRYVLGPRLIAIGQAGLRATELLGVSAPHMKRLFDEIQETTVLTVRDGPHVIIVSRIQAQHRLVSRYDIGERLPVYCTATGQVLLSEMTADEVRALLKDVPFESRGPNTLRSVSKLIDRLAEVRRYGFALNDQELAVGHLSIAAAVRDHGGEIVAALSVSAPTVRVTAEQMARVAVNSLVPTAAAIGAELAAPADEPAA